jgi:hypothetical protein
MSLDDVETKRGSQGSYICGGTNFGQWMFIWHEHAHNRRHSAASFRWSLAG